MDSESVTIRTVQAILQAIIIIIGSFLLSIVFIYLFSEYIHFYNDIVAAILVLIAMCLSIYFAGILSTGNTTLSISYGSLFIESQTPSVNIYKLKKIALDQIKAYEIHKIRNKFGSTIRLVFYRPKLLPVVIVLKELSPLQENELISFMGSHKIIPVKELGTLSGQSFWQAFLRVLLTVLTGIVLFLAAYISVLFVFYKIYHHFPDPDITFIALSMIWAFITAYLIIQNLLKFYRIAANSTWILIGIMLPCMAYFIQDRLEIFFQKPLLVENVTDIKLYPYQKFFNIRNFSCDTTLTGYYKTSSSGSMRSRSITVKHYFTSPLITSEDSPRDLRHSYWASDMYSQSISKWLSATRQNVERIDFMNRKLHDFNRSLHKSTTLFEVVYSESNPRAKKENYLFPVLSIGRIKPPLFILRPHTENFAALINSTKEQAFIIEAVFSVLLIICALVIATNR